MYVPQWMLIAAGEVLLVITIAAWFLIRKGRSYHLLKELLKISRQRKQQQPNRAQDLSSQARMRKLENQASYATIIEQALDETRLQFKRLHPCDKVFLKPQHSLEKQALALRYLFLDAEKAGLQHSANWREQWQVISHSLKEIATTYADAINDAAEAEAHQYAYDEGEDVSDISRHPKKPSLLDASPDVDDGLEGQLEIYQERVKNLEEFKTLYFEVQDELVELKEQLANLQKQGTDPDENRKIMGSPEGKGGSEASAGVYGPIDNNLNAAKDSPKAEYSRTEIRTVEQNTNPNQESDQPSIEVFRLRSDNRKKMHEIETLRSELSQLEQGGEEQRSDALKAKDRFIKQLEGYISEANMCSELLENELTGAHKEIDQLKQRQVETPETDKPIEAEDSSELRQEMERLRHDCVSQREKILELNCKVADLEQNDVPPELVNKQETEIEALSSNLREADSCTMQLEQELEMSIKEIDQLRMQITAAEEKSADSEQLEKAVIMLKKEKREMLNLVEQLEQEAALVADQRDRMKDKLKRAASQNKDFAQLSEKYSQLEQRYLASQRRH